MVKSSNLKKRCDICWSVFKGLLTYRNIPLKFFYRGEPICLQDCNFAILRKKAKYAQEYESVPKTLNCTAVQILGHLFPKPNDLQFFRAQKVKAN